MRALWANGCMRNWIILFLASGLLTACQEDIRIDGFESQKWKADPNGCNGDRKKLMSLLLKSQKRLIGHSEMEIKAFLGKPDAQDLQTRGQKFFEYGAEGNSLCDPESSKAPTILRIRFDALDRVTEIALYE